MSEQKKPIERMLAHLASFGNKIISEIQLHRLGLLRPPINWDRLTEQSFLHAQVSDVTKMPPTQGTSVAWTGTGSHLTQSGINESKQGMAIKATHLPPQRLGPTLLSVLLLVMAM